MDGHVSGDELFREGMRLYREGTDAIRAAALLRDAAELGHSGAQFWYGDCLESGRGIGRDTREAGAYYRLARANGDLSGKAAVGHCLVYGLGVPGDPEHGYRLIREAAHAGSPIGMGYMSILSQTLALDGEMAPGMIRA
jgi:TPR repeat protein